MQCPIKHRRLPVPIGQQKSLGQEEVDDSNKRNSPENRDKHTKHESDVNHHDNRGIFVMHQIDWTGIKINVLLLSNALSCCSCSKYFSAVKPSEDEY